MMLPVWAQFALGDLGTREDTGNRGPAVRRYIKLAGCGKEGDPWCAIFANAVFALANIPGTRSALAQSFSRDKNFVKLIGPAMGCVVVFWRGSKKSGLGHVGFYMGELGDYIYTLGGNESDAVAVERYPRNGRAMGLIGYYWPKSVVLPTIGPVSPKQAAAIGVKVT